MDFNEFQVVTSRVTEDAILARGSFPVVPASISFAVLANNSILFSGETASDESGLARVVSPSELAIPSGAKLRVNAMAGGAEAARQVVQWEKTFTPDPNNHEIYQDSYVKWREIYKPLLEMAGKGIVKSLW